MATALPLVISAALLALAAVYAAIVGSWALGFQRLLRRDGGRRERERPLVSVIIPARDEASTIRACLESVLACDYPEDLFEVIVVDDLSRDGTAELVRQLIHETALARLPVAALIGGEDLPEEPPARLRLLQMPAHLERTRAHKKRAISRGITEARGEIILTTDADCVVPPTWIHHMASCFTESVGLVSGPVLYPASGGPVRRVQALEFLGLVAVGAGAIGAGLPNLCNGANIAYRRSVFDEVGGFQGIDHLTSGDDELLMQKIAYTTDWEVTFCHHRGAAVITDGATSLGGFIQQRKRWASKGRHYPHRAIRATIGAIYAYYLLLLAAPAAVLAGALPPTVLAATLLIKIVPEAFLLWPASRHFGRGRLMVYFLPAQLLHVPYIVAMGTAGAIGGYEWKGRAVSR